MDSNDTTDDSGWNLMYQTNVEIHIRENAKVTQHDPYFKTSDVGDDEEHIEAPHQPILAVNVSNKNTHIHQSETLLKVHTRYRPCSSFTQFYSNCPKQQIIFNHCYQVDLKTL